MDTIILEYDKANSAARQILENILKTGFFKITEKQNKLDVSLEEEKMGLTNSYDSLEDFLKKMNS